MDRALGERALRSGKLMKDITAAHSSLSQKKSLDKKREERRGAARIAEVSSNEILDLAHGTDHMSFIMKTCSTDSKIVRCNAWPACCATLMRVTSSHLRSTPTMSTSRKISTPVDSAGYPKHRNLCHKSSIDRAVGQEAAPHTPEAQNLRKRVDSATGSLTVSTVFRERKLPLHGLKNRCSTVLFTTKLI